MSQIEIRRGAFWLSEYLVGPNSYRTFRRSEKEGGSKAFREIAIRIEYVLRELSMTAVTPSLVALEAQLRRSLQASKNDVGLLLQLSALLASSERSSEAEPFARKACALAPQHPQPPYSYGLILRDLGRWTEAESALSRSIALDPSNGGSWLVRGVVKMDMHALDDAVADFDQAILRLPRTFEPYAYKSNALRQLSRYAEALREIDAALAVRPNSADGHRARAMLLGSLRRYPEGLQAIDRALELASADPDAWAAKGDLCVQSARHADAIAAFEQALSLAPSRIDIEEHLIVTRRAGCDWRHFDHDNARVIALARDPKYPIRPFNLLTFDTSSADQLFAARKYIKTFAPAAAGVKPSFPRPRAGGPVRVAYLSSDLRNHAISALIVGVIERHDQSKVEVIAISTGRDDGSPLRRRVEAAFGAFVDSSKWSDERIAKYVRDQHIDVLVDVNGLSGDARPRVLAQRAAPVQVAFLGYPGTSGASYVDYIIADSVVIPPADRDNFSERIVYLPNSYQPNDDRREVAEFSPSRSELGLPEDGFVYCCFNAAYKLTPATFYQWLRILAATPSSVLWLMEYNPLADANLRLEATRRGISPERIVFAPFAERADHLARIRRADLFLDTTPYNAHTTTSDALWAGVPVLTCPGVTFPARVAASLLQAAGFPELIVPTPQDYEAAAIDLAGAPAQLDVIRRKLAQTTRASALFDTRRFARDLERAFLAIHSRYLAHQAPADIHLA